MTAASFWPFLIRSAASIVLISELGAVPINAGRNSGSFGCAEGVVMVIRFLAFAMR